jgi:hypothetical protein
MERFGDERLGPNQCFGNRRCFGGGLVGVWWVECVTGPTSLRTSNGDIENRLAIRSNAFSSSALASIGEAIRSAAEKPAKTTAESAIVELQASNPKSGTFSNAQPSTYVGALKLSGKVC